MSLVFINTCKSSAIGLLTLTVIACSGGGSSSNSSNGSNPNSVNGTAALQGTWISGCEIDDDDGEIRTFDISGSTIDVTLDMYQHDPSCTTQSQKITYSGTYVTGSQVQLSTGAPATQWDVSLQSSMATIYDLDQVNDSNSAQGCGKSDWQVGVSVDVTNCPGSEVPRTVYEIFRVDGTDLVIGDNSGDTDSAATRPTGLDLTTPLALQ